jgi:ABC-type transporter Mla subunit MlaD
MNQSSRDIRRANFVFALIFSPLHCPILHMAKQRNEFAAGLFILVAILLAGGIYFAIRGSGMALESRQSYQVQFSLTDDVGGLRAGSEVRLGGVKVGQVSSVKIMEDAKNSAGPQIVVAFSMPARFQLRDDAKVDVQSALTGAVNLNITSLGTGAVATGPVAGKGSAMGRLFNELSSTSTDISQVVRDVRNVTLPKVNKALDTAPDTVASIKSTSDNANELVTQIRGKVDPVIERYNKVADAAAGAMNEVSEFAGGGKADFRETLANLNKTTNDVKTRLPSLLDRIGATVDDTRTAVNKASGALDTVKEVSINAKDATAAARSILVSNRGRIDEMVKSLRSTATNLDAASVEIRRSPWRLLYQPTNAEVANLNLYDSARQIATASQRLADATIALRDAASDPDVDAKTVQELMKTLEGTFADFRRVEDTLWKNVK